MPTLGRGSSKMVSRSLPPSNDLCSQTKYHSGNLMDSLLQDRLLHKRLSGHTLEEFSTFCLTIHCIPREDRLPIASVKSNVWGYWEGKSQGWGSMGPDVCTWSVCTHPLLSLPAQVSVPLCHWRVIVFPGPQLHFLGIQAIFTYSQMPIDLGSL